MPLTVQLIISFCVHVCKKREKVKINLNYGRSYVWGIKTPVFTTHILVLTDHTYMYNTVLQDYCILTKLQHKSVITRRQSPKHNHHHKRGADGDGRDGMILSLDHALIINSDLRKCVHCIY